MRIISARIRLSAAIGLLSVVSLLYAGCSGRYQYVGFASGYYPSNRSPSAYSGEYAKLEPTRADGAASMHRATLKGYNVLGKRYYPQIMPIGWRETGVASWYGSDFHGKKTSNGETYDMYAPGTAAHKTLPMNTILLVTRKDTGAQVKVRVNDRGPFIAGRIIDLSYTAGKAIGLDKAGTAMVTIEVIEYDSYISSQLGLKNQRFTYTVSAGETKSQTAAKTNGYALQLGSFKSLDWANKLKTDSVPKAGGKDVVIKTVSFGREKIHRVLIGEFDTKEEAIRFKNENGFSSAVVVSVS